MIGLDYSGPELISTLIESACKQKGVGYGKTGDHHWA